MQKLSAGPVRAGSHFRHILAIMGTRMEAELEVAETRAAELHVFSASGRPFAFDARVVLTESQAAPACRPTSTGARKASAA